MAFRLDGMNALVPGASKGIGNGIARAFAEAGANVIVTGRKQADADGAAKAIGPNASGLALDTADLADVDRAFAEASARFGGRIDVLVLNSGGPPPGPAMGVSSDRGQTWWTTMFVSLVRLADRALPGMIERKFGRIISVVSSSVIQPIPNLGMSNSIRPAIIGWGKSVSNEVAKHGVTVNAIAPGRIATERLDQLDSGRSDEPHPRRPLWHDGGVRGGGRVPRQPRGLFHDRFHRPRGRRPDFQHVGSIVPWR
jgi:3-oxoacyl-[acyl-carrier protein] reductase